jgi:hypothetical protein
MRLNKKFPVLANTRPWNELILRGKRKFKSIHIAWKYRGTVYLYDTKGKPEDWVCQDYELKESDFGVGGQIVGTAKVVGVRGEDILLAKPKRFRTPIPYVPARGSIRISRIH